MSSDHPANQNQEPSLSKPLFHSSWANRFINWIDSFAAPRYVQYFVFILLLAFLSHLFRWIDGSLPFNQVDMVRIVEAPLMIMPMAFFHYLNRLAKLSFIEFRPALTEDESQSLRLQYQLTTIPPRGALIASAVGAVIGLLSLFGDPHGYGITPNTSILTTIYTTIITLFSFSFIGLLTYQTARQLQLVNRLYRLASNVNLFHLRPLYAFSSLTARTGILILFFVYYGTLVISFANAGSAAPMTTQDLVTFGLVSLLAIACFIMPLLGIHQRISKEKERLLVAVGQRMQITLQVIHRHVDERNFESIDNINKALASLMTEREWLQKISTWPWKNETLRGFASAVVLPVVVWLATTSLSLLFGF